MPATPKKKPPPAIIVQRETPLTTVQLKDGLRQLGPDDGLPMLALHQLIDQLLVSEINEVADPRTAESATRMAHCSGGIDVLATLKSRVAELRQT